MRKFLKNRITQVQIFFFNLEWLQVKIRNVLPQEAQKLIINGETHMVKIGEKYMGMDGRADFDKKEWGKM